MLARASLTASEAALLYEDFSAPELVAEPGPELLALPAPITDADLSEARRQAYADGLRDGEESRAARDAAHASSSLAAAAAALSDAAATVTAQLDDRAHALAKLLLAVIGKLFPALCAKHGAAEVAGLVQVLLPALTFEPAITVRVAPSIVDAVSELLDRLDPGIRARVTTAAGCGLLPGDARIEWHCGGAIRDTAGLWRAIRRALARDGLTTAPELDDSTSMWAS